MSGIAYTPLVNGQAYAWSNTYISLLKNVAIGVSNIEYSDSQEIENVYGGGINPVTRGFGNYTAEAKITFHMEELESLVSISPTGRLQDIPEFDVQVSFIPDNLAKRITHTIKNCRFASNGRTVAQNDKSIEHECELVVSHIEWTE